VFFEVLRLLLENGVTVVAEAAFQNWVWRPNLGPILPLCELRVVQCHADPDAVRDRFIARGPRNAHADDIWLVDWEQRVRDFERLRLRVPSIDVDTTDGYRPALAEVVAFVS
jgi:predicted kinase